MYILPLTNSQKFSNKKLRGLHYMGRYYYDKLNKGLIKGNLENYPISTENAIKQLEHKEIKDAIDRGMETGTKEGFESCVQFTLKKLLQERISRAFDVD